MCSTGNTPLEDVLKSLTSKRVEVTTTSTHVTVEGEGALDVLKAVNGESDEFPKSSKSHHSRKYQDNQNLGMICAKWLIFM